MTTPPSSLASAYRTHTCGALRRGEIGQTVVLLGWAHRIRDLGGVLFIDVRDRHGLTQVVVRTGSPAAATAAAIRSEYVVAVRGRVEARVPEAVNPKLPTGEIEVVADELVLLNEAGLNVSATVAPVTAAGPALLTTIVYVIELPGTAVVALSVFVIERSATGTGPTTVVVAVLELFDKFVSAPVKPEITWAVLLMIVPFAVPGFTVTTIVNVAL
jgi:hypothetical protein